MLDNHTKNTHRFSIIITKDDLLFKSIIKYRVIIKYRDKNQNTSYEWSAIIYNYQIINDCLSIHRILYKNNLYPSQIMYPPSDQAKTYYTCNNCVFTYVGRLKSQCQIVKL